MVRAKRPTYGRRRFLWNAFKTGAAIALGYGAVKGAPVAWIALEQFEWRKAFKQFISRKKSALEKNPELSRAFGQVEFHNPPTANPVVEISRIRAYRGRLSQAHALPKQKQLFQAIAARFSRVYGIDPKLVLAMIHVESSYQPKSMSLRTVNQKQVPNAFGLMQIVRATDQFIQRKQLRKIVPVAAPGTKTNPDGKRVPLRDLFDPLYNLDGGIAYLDYLREQAQKAGVESPQDQLKLAVMAYNQGFEGVQKNPADAREAETYFLSVTNAYQQLKELNVNELERDAFQQRGI